MKCCVSASQLGLAPLPSHVRRTARVGDTGTTSRPVPISAHERAVLHTSRDSMAFVTFVVEVAVFAVLAFFIHRTFAILAYFTGSYSISGETSLDLGRRTPSEI